MRKLMVIFTLSLAGSWSFAAGGAGNPLTVSSGTFLAVDLYTNADGSNRQAIVIGDFTSSDTARVNQGQGLQVYLGTSSASGIGTLTGITGTVNTYTTNITTVSQATAANLKASVLIDGTSNTVQITGTPNVAVTNTPTVNNFTANITTVTFNSIGQPITSTSVYVVNKTTVALQIQDGASALTSVGYQSGGGSIPVNVLNTVAVSGSFSANSPSTGAVNSTTPGIATLIGAQGVGGNTSLFRVDSSSYLYVNVAAGGAAGGTSSNFISAFPAVGTAAGFVSPSGTMQGARVDISSNVFVTQTTAANLKASVLIDGTSNTVQITGTPTVAQSGTWTVQPGNTSNTSAWVVTSTGEFVQGMVASSGTNANNPVKIGVVVSTFAIAPFNGGQIADIQANHNGALITQLDCSRENIVKSSTALSATTTETVILSSGATGVYNDVLEIIALNTSATAARIDFRGSGTGGQAIEFGIYVPAGETRGFTTAHPWPQTNAASQWTAQSSASVTDIRLYGLFCKTK